MPVLLMLVFALTRWPGLMPPNFSAVYGLLFCAGAFLPGRLGWWLPISTVFVTDLLLNLFYYRVAPVTVYTLANYGVFVGIIALGRWFTSRASWLALLGGGILGALLFYVVTNTVAWLQNPEYQKTLAGWIQALTIGTSGWPQTWEFFRSTLISGGLFTGLFAGAMKLSEALEPKEERDPAEESEGEAAESEEKPAEAGPEGVKA
jgi:hypothetical protein